MKGILLFASFWFIGVSLIAGRCCYDLKTYFLGDTLVYRFVIQNGKPTYRRKNRSSNRNNIARQ
jgi:hypothetical protein